MWWLKRRAMPAPAGAARRRACRGEPHGRLFRAALRHRGRRSTPKACTTSSPRSKSRRSRRGKDRRKRASRSRCATRCNTTSTAAPAPTRRRIASKSSSSATQLTVIVDITSGRPDAQVDGVNGELPAHRNRDRQGRGEATTTFTHVDYDIPGQEQRFAKQRAQRDAEDRAAEVVAETIRNRLASYFVAGT